MLFILILSFGSIFFYASCDSGSEKPKAPEREPIDSNGDIVDKDPSQMNLSELKLRLSELKSRDSVELDEFNFLKAMNKELCNRFQRIRSECIVSAPLFGADKILGCDGEFEENTSISHKFFVELSSSQNINFKIVANNNIESTVFKGGSTEITFGKNGNEQQEAPSLEDLTNLRLESVGSVLPAVYNLGFKFTIDETLLFTGDHLIEEGEGDDKFYRLNISKITEISESESCRMQESELETIEQSVRARAEE